MAYKIKIDREKCIGCGSCESICSDTFEIKNEKAVAKKEIIENISCEKEAEEVCPTQAIIIEEK